MSRRAPARAPVASTTLAALTIAALIATTMLAPSRARAKATVQATTTASAGWTDNILNAPDEPVAVGPARESDFFFQIIPGAVVSSASPRFLQRLAYTFTADLFVTHTEANSYSNTLDWAADVLASKQTAIIFTLQSQQGRLSTFNINQASAGAPITVLPANSDINFFSQNFGENLESAPRAKWRVQQATGLRAFIPIDRGIAPDSYTVFGEVGFDRIFHVDSLGLLLRAEIAEYIAARDPLTNVPAGDNQQQVLTSLVSRWRRDWSPFWSTEADLGVVFGVGSSSAAMSQTQTAVEPTALAAVRWAKDIGNAELRYAHDVTPNPIAGNTFAIDEVALQGSLPLAKAKMYLSATAAYEHVRLLSLVAGVGDESADLVLADFTIGWQPIPEVGLFARYSLYDQFGKPQAPVDLMPQPTPPLLPDLTRSTVLVGINVIYPAVAAARIPTRTGTRVDRGDQAGFPELHAPQPR